MLHILESGEWKPLYSFDLGHVTAEDIEVGNHYTSTSPQTHFTQMIVVGIPTPGGRNILRDLELTEVAAESSRSRTVGNDSLLDLLDRTFGIELAEIPRANQKQIQIDL